MVVVLVATIVLLDRINFDRSKTDVAYVNKSFLSTKITSVLTKVTFEAKSEPLSKKSCFPYTVEFASDKSRFCQQKMFFWVLFVASILLKTKATPVETEVTFVDKSNFCLAFVNNI